MRFLNLQASSLTYHRHPSSYHVYFDNKTDEVEPISMQEGSSEVGIQGHTQLENLISELENVEECESCAI